MFVSSSSSSSSQPGPGAYAPDALQPEGLLCSPCSNRSHFRRQMSPRPTRRERSKQWKVELLWARNWQVILPRMSTLLHFRVLLHAVNLRHGTDGFTSPPKEGVLRIFSPLKIRRLRPGMNPRTWVLKANTLLLDHRSCCFKVYIQSTWDVQQVYLHCFLHAIISLKPISRFGVLKKKQVTGSSIS